MSSLLAVAEALDALDDFRALFLQPEARTLDEVEMRASLVKHARPRARRRVRTGPARVERAGRRGRLIDARIGLRDKSVTLSRHAARQERATG